MLGFFVSAILIALTAALPLQLVDDDGYLFRSTTNDSASLFPNRVYGLSFTVEIGNATNPKYPQSINLAFSTASTDTFVGKLGFTKGPYYGPLYDPRRSKTSTLINKNYLYVDGPVKVKGETYTDLFTFAHDVPQVMHQFGAITDLEGLERMYVNGQLGMAWKPYSDPPHSPTTPVIYGFLSKNSRKLYQVYADLYTQAFCMGCERIEECPKNDFKFAAVMVGKPVPMLEVKSLEIGKYHFATSTPALLDANVNSILMPADQMRAAIRVYNAEFDSKLGVYMTDCKTAQVEWTFEFSKMSAELENNQFIFYTGRDYERCALLIGYSVTAEPTYTLGAPLFYKYCATFDIDENKIGIAKSVKRT